MSDITCLGVSLFKEYDRMYGVNKGGYEQEYEVCCVCVLICFSVIFRMGLLMGGSSDVTVVVGDPLM